jgi:hypothetical protein
MNKQKLKEPEKIKIRAKINDLEAKKKKTIKRINKTKNWFCGKKKD